VLDVSLSWLPLSSASIILLSLRASTTSIPRASTTTTLRRATAGQFKFASLRSIPVISVPHLGTPFPITYQASYFSWDPLVAD
jgi:hypothetical protein